jgi:hypothetical protein
MKLRLSIALLLTLTPMLAFAQPRPQSMQQSLHRHSQITHDRTPKVHLHSSKPHLNQ